MMSQISRPKFSGRIRLKVTRCKYCSESIDFDDEHIGHSGKKIPLDIDTGEPHYCIARPRKTINIKKCHKCKQEIFFNPDRRNPANGKLIPQDIFGNHRCEEEDW